jgi:hypothetical protein
MASRPNAAPDSDNAAIGATVDKAMENPETDTALKVGLAFRHFNIHQQSQSAERRSCQCPAVF